MGLTDWLSPTVVLGFGEWCRSRLWSISDIEPERLRDPLLEIVSDDPPAYRYRYAIQLGQNSRPIKPFRLCVVFSSRVDAPVCDYIPKGESPYHSFFPPFRGKKVYIELRDRPFRVGDVLDLFLDVDSRNAQIRRVRRWWVPKLRRWKPGERPRD